MAKNADIEALRELFQHHIESYDYLVETGLEKIMNSIKPVEIRHPFSSTKLRNILFY